MKLDQSQFELVVIDGELAVIVRLGRSLGEHISKVEHVRRKYTVEVQGEPLRLFLPAVCQTIHGERCKARKLYDIYCSWSRARGEDPINNRAFKAAMIALGFNQVRSNGLHWEDVRLRPDWAENAG